MGLTPLWIWAHMITAKKTSLQKILPGPPNILTRLRAMLSVGLIGYPLRIKQKCWLCRHQITKAEKQAIIVNNNLAPRDGLCSKLLFRKYEGFKHLVNCLCVF